MDYSEETVKRCIEMKLSFKQTYYILAGDHYGNDALDFLIRRGLSHNTISMLLDTFCASNKKDAELIKTMKEFMK